MLQNEGFCQQTQHLPQTWRLVCLSPGFHCVWLPDRTSALAEVCVLSYVSYFCKLIHISTFKGILQNLSKAFAQHCILCVWIFGLSSVFKPIEANTCLLLYIWAVNVNKVITDLAQNVLFFLLFAIRDQLIEGCFDKKPSLVKEEWPGLCSTLPNLALLNLGSSLLWRRTAAQ